MQWLTELYHPKTTLKLNDEESNLAVYIFGHQYNQKADELIILFILF
jgi:glycosylphosphatidylinositol transamidase (GPIT) subunit GPI8